MTKTLIDIPDDLMAEAMDALGAKTKAEAVRTALTLVSRQERQRRAIRTLSDSDLLTELTDESRAAAWQ